MKITINYIIGVVLTTIPELFNTILILLYALFGALYYLNRSLIDSINNKFDANNYTKL